MSFKKMFNSEFSIFFCLMVLNLSQIVWVKSDCVIRYPDNMETAPIYTKYFGRYKFELPYTRSDIILQNAEIIYAKCHTMFSTITKEHEVYHHNGYESIYIKNQTEITLQCVGNALQYNNDFLQDNEFKCKKLDWSLYENDSKQQWCKTDTGLAALLLATKTRLGHHILAEICFNLNDWSLQTVTYNATVPNVNTLLLRDVGKTNLQTIDRFGENLWNLKTTQTCNITQLNLQEGLKEMSQHNSWLHLANYELSPIAQSKSYENYFAEFSNILNTIWWSNLRLGNWKRFMDTLENYAYNNSFQLYTGASGVVRKPTENSVDIKTDLTIKFDFKTIAVPAYIWTYLTSIDRKNKDFIIVGYNSPYAEFFPRKEIVFCPDICDEIAWLNKISMSFKFNTAGIMFCCSPESMQQINPLNGFPMEVLNSRMNTMTKEKTEIEIKEPTATTTKQYTIPNREMRLDHVADNEVRFSELIHKSVEEVNKNDEGMK